MLLPMKMVEYLCFEGGELDFPIDEMYKGFWPNHEKEYHKYAASFADSDSRYIIWWSANDDLRI